MKKYLILNNYWTSYRQALFDEILDVNPDACCTYAASIPMNRRKMGWKSVLQKDLAWNLPFFRNNLIIPKPGAIKFLRQFDRILVSSGRDMVIFVIFLFILRLFSPRELFLWLGDPLPLVDARKRFLERVVDRTKTFLIRWSDGLVVYSQNTIRALNLSPRSNTPILIAGQVANYDFRERRAKDSGEVVKIGFLNGHDLRKNRSQLLKDISELPEGFAHPIEIHDVCGTVAEDLVSEGVTLVRHPYMEREAFLGFLAELDVFVMCSVNEPWGFAAAEAIAAGCPVLCSENCGISTLFPRECLYPIGDAQLLQQRLKNLEQIWFAEKNALITQGIERHARIMDVFLSQEHHQSEIKNGYA